MNRIFRVVALLSAIIVTTGETSQAQYYGYRPQYFGRVGGSYVGRVGGSYGYQPQHYGNQTFARVPSYGVGQAPEERREEQAAQGPPSQFEIYRPEYNAYEGLIYYPDRQAYQHLYYRPAQ